MELKIKNYMEDVVLDKMSAILKTMPDVCDCERCRLDIFALAMNNCPPKYIVTQRGSIYSRLNILQNQFAVDVMRAVTDAAIRVGESPRHNKEEEIYIQ